MFSYLFGFWMVLVTVLSLISGIQIDTGDLPPLPLDKFVHFIFYALAVIFGAMMWKERRPAFRFDTNTLFLMAFIAMLYGMVIEAFQYSFTADRTAEWMDVLANCLGAIGGALLTKRLNDKIWALKTRSK